MRNSVEASLSSLGKTVTIDRVLKGYREAETPDEMRAMDEMAKLLSDPDKPLAREWRQKRLAQLMERVDKETGEITGNDAPGR